MKHRLGVYVASHNNPVFLRQCLLQIAAQTRLPDVLAIHENVHQQSYLWAVRDVMYQLESNGVRVLHHHTPAALTMPTFFCRPLKHLLNAGCTLFNKLDVDDIIYSNHLEEQETAFNLAQVDYVLNPKSQLLVLLDRGGYKYNADVDFGTWNPTGAHPNAVTFNRAVAEEFVQAMYEHAGKGADDLILKEYVMPKFKGVTCPSAPTMCYVAHNRTWSTWQWAQDPPPEVK